MATYHFHVIETQTISSKYTVEADSLEEAVAKAKIGDTVAEDRQDILAVADRQIVDKWGNPPSKYEKAAAAEGIAE